MDGDADVISQLNQGAQEYINSTLFRSFDDNFFNEYRDTRFRYQFRLQELRGALSRHDLSSIVRTTCADLIASNNLVIDDQMLDSLERNLRREYSL